ncbi:MAG: hypothetical protein WAU39_13905 [Polyangiales bacterium]
MGESQKVVGIITLCVVGLLPVKLSAQDDGIQSETLQVGVSELQPFAMKPVDGQWEELREYGSVQALTEAFVKGDIDLTPIDLWLHSGHL